MTIISQNNSKGGSYFLLGSIATAIAADKIEKIIDFFTNFKDKYKEADPLLIKHIDTAISTLNIKIANDEKNYKDLVKNNNIDIAVSEKIKLLLNNINNHKENIKYLKFFKSKIDIKIYTFSIIVKVEKKDENKINNKIKTTWCKYWKSHKCENLRFIDIFLKNGYMIFDCHSNIKLNSQKLEDIKKYLVTVLPLFNVNYTSHINFIKQSLQK